MVERTEFEPTPERSEAEYEEYRKVVDALSPAFRKVGIGDEEGYKQAMSDPRTIRMRIGRIEMPCIAPMVHVSGYDESRCERLTGQENVALLAMPMAAFGDPEVQLLLDSHEAPDQMAIVVETDHEETEEAKAMLVGLLAGTGEYQPADFLDPRIRRPEEQPAMMAMYETHFDSTDPATGEYVEPTAKDFFAAYKELEAEDHPIVRYTKLLSIEQLRENEELFEKLWDLCKDRFDWLGRFHPVSMEDTKDFFRQMVMSEMTHTIVRFNEEGEPGGLGFFMESLDECDWIDPDHLAKLTTLDRFVYFYGIATRTPEDAAKYGQDIMQLLSLMAGRIGGKHQLIFESTNMSSRYIPRLISIYAGQGAGLTMTEPITRIAQVDYWYLSPKTD